MADPWSWEFSLAYAEVYMTIANLFRRLEMELFETEEDDVRIVCDAIVGHPKKGSRGVRVKVLNRWRKS